MTSANVPTITIIIELEGTPKVSVGASTAEDQAALVAWLEVTNVEALVAQALEAVRELRAA